MKAFPLDREEPVVANDMAHVGPRLPGLRGERLELGVGERAFEVVALGEIEQHDEVHAEAYRTLFGNKVGNLRLRQHTAVEFDETVVFHVISLISSPT